MDPSLSRGDRDHSIQARGETMLPVSFALRKPRRRRRAR